MTHEVGAIACTAYPAYSPDTGVRCVAIGWREALGGRRLTLTIVTLPEA